MLGWKFHIAIGSIKIIKFIHSTIQSYTIHNYRQYGGSTGYDKHVTTAMWH